ncbi:MAG TPA: hypothetical protein VEH30_15950 [Terriglobales bacterium]|nr:hypothetical protein [Terriglobales bacterium]
MRGPSHQTIVVFLLVLLMSQYCGAQDASQALAHPEPGDPGALEIQPPPGPPVHAFWDRENLLLFSGIAVMRGLDYASTRNFQARGRKEILLAPEVVNNSAAFASLEAAGTMTSVGISYIFHRTGHHTLERWMSIGHISVTGFGDVRNYCLKSKHR